MVGALALSCVFSSKLTFLPKLSLYSDQFTNLNSLLIFVCAQSQGHVCPAVCQGMCNNWLSEKDTYIYIFNINYTDIMDVSHNSQVMKYTMLFITGSIESINLAECFHRFLLNSFIYSQPVVDE